MKKRIILLAVILSAASSCSKDSATTGTTTDGTTTTTTTTTTTSGSTTGTDAATTTCTGTTVEQIVCAATSFISSLSTTQQATTVLTYNKTDAVKWSNLPCGSSCRVGIQLSTLSTTQLANAKAVVKAAMGTVSGTGYDQAMQILLADDVLGTQRSGYSSGTYFISFLGTPTTTGTWQLQFGGHHLAVNITVSAGVITGASPFFIGVEPKTWTSGTTTYAPLAANQSTMAAMLASLTSSQLASAKLSSTFSDVVLGPGSDGKFPATKVGVAASTFTSAQKALVLAAIKQWGSNVDDATATSLLATYSSEMDNTYIAYSGSSGGTSGSAGTFLISNADYVRIDGPSIWIEFVCQSGVVYTSQIHYHSIYRDHVRDYGNNFTF
ncbi:DUF3500 domain-containing protein [Mucilaginibacter sp. ZT4R22]|uniref:DUF3500 domain-containing protein n=1 Tax=Mucilaginibacter pankratovii TaxID=2772110 RepID=A0ABR7WRY7_9SPHI|nr:DUF3500 domain-containing protein [Mucilaginibacter pankratovii]MBD1365069.1 DUF3500 domain-containing protein [Mucilaginibacter pankratovii]